jgi:methyltransferase, FkbM family
MEVEVQTLDDLMSAIGPRRPCLLKIDVQGYELEVLSGGRRFLQVVDDVIVECSVRPLYEGAPFAEDVIAMLAEEGFCLVDVGGDLRESGSRRALQFDLQFSRSETRCAP